MLKLLRTLPKVLKYLPSDKAKDARNFMMSFQVIIFACDATRHNRSIANQPSSAVIWISAKNKALILHYG